MSDHRDHDLDGPAWRSELDQAQAAAKDTAPIVAQMYRDLRLTGLGFFESIFLAAAWIWALSRPHPVDDDEEE